MSADPKEQATVRVVLTACKIGKPIRFLYDAFSEKGLIGCIHSGTGDLNTNPKHMEGFGRDAWPEDSD